MAKELTAVQSGAARKLALMVCDMQGHSHLTFNSCCAPNFKIAEKFFQSLVTKKLI